MADNSGGGSTGGRLLLVGVVLFLVSWFVPVYAGQQVFGALQGWTKELGASQSAMAAGIEAPEWLPGWGACKFAWQLLLDTEGGDGEWKRRLAGSSCLTNLVMLLGFLLLLRGRQRVFVGLAVLACSGVNASWIYLADTNPFEVYRVGYFLWLASFPLVGLGALLQPGRAKAK